MAKGISIAGTRFTVLPPAKSQRIVPLLLDWFNGNARDLPWRHTSDPYAIWVSEIMLQQTQVKTVIPFWKRWMKALPAIRFLARAKPARIHKLWEGLGYYSRVRNMQAAARVIVKKHGGHFPSQFEEVLELPGIGRYTAGAICSIAFNQPRPILDGNVIRVLCRAFGVEGSPRDKVTNEKLWALAGQLVLAAQAAGLEMAGEADARAAKRETPPCCSHLNQSLMELGALICTPRQPRCDLCPLAEMCVARRQGRIEALPNVAPRPRTTRRRFVAFVSRRGGKVLVRQRPGGVVNAHLWEFPNAEINNLDGEVRESVREVVGEGAAPSLTPLCTIRHSITRYRIQLDVFEADFLPTSGSKPAAAKWVKRTELKRLAFCAAHKKILAHL